MSAGRGISPAAAGLIGQLTRPAAPPMCVCCTRPVNDDAGWYELRRQPPMGGDTYALCSLACVIAFARGGAF